MRKDAIRQSVGAGSIRFNAAFAFYFNVAFNVGMDKDQTKALIDKAGGDTAFARYLGIDKKRGYQQRVNNWKRRGIPSEAMLKHQRQINSLARKLIRP